MLELEECLRLVRADAWERQGLMPYPLRHCDSSTDTEASMCLPVPCDTDAIESLVLGVRPAAPNLHVHPEAMLRLLLCNFRGGECDEGSYGKVYRLDSVHTGMCVRQDAIVLKKCPIADDVDFFGEKDDDSPPRHWEGWGTLGVSESTFRVISPFEMDAVAEPIIQHLVNKHCHGTRRITGRVRGTMCEDLQMALSHDRPPNMYIWMDHCGEDSMDVLERLASRDTAKLIRCLEDLVKQVAAHILQLAEVGISHNDLHLGNIRVERGERTSTSDADENVIQEDRYLLIDFGMSSIDSQCCDESIRESIQKDIEPWLPEQGHFVMGGRIMEDLLLTRDVVNNDIRTLALDIYVSYAKQLKNLDQGSILHRLFEMALTWTTPVPGTSECYDYPLVSVSAIRLFKNMGYLKRSCREQQVKMRSKTRDFKNPRSCRGKFHIIRELMLQPNASKITCEDLRALIGY